MALSRPHLGVACLIVGGALLLAGGFEALRESSTGAPVITLPVVLLAGLAVAALGAAAEFFGWVQTETDEPERPKNSLIHGAARPASEAETQAAALGIVTPKPAQETKFPD